MWWRQYRYGRSRKERLQDMIVNVAAVMVLVLVVASLRGLWGARKVSVRAAEAAALRAPVEAVTTLRRFSAEAGLDFAEVLAVYMLDNAFFRKAAEPLGEEALVSRYIDGHKKLKRAIGEKTVAPYAAYLRRLATEITCFPVLGQDGAVMYGDSFGAAIQGGAYAGIDIFDEMREAGRLRVAAVARGVVVEAGQNKAEGHYAVIQSASGTLYKYAHLAYVHADMAEGAQVEAGTPIGYMGESGLEGRNDLFPVRLTVSVLVESEVLNGAAWVNPYIFLRLVENGR